MILTVTPNTAIDRTYFIKEFLWGKTIRSSQSVIGMGGKATDASWILSEMGIENIATGFAAGEVGRMMESMLRRRGGYTDFIWVDGETRTNIIIAGEDNRLQTTLVGGGLQISSAHVNQLLEKFTSLLRLASCVIVGGSVPLGLNPEIYTQLIRQALNSRIPVVFDASGPSLRSGLEGRPTIAKPNLDEISDLVGGNVSTIEQAYISASALMEKYQSSIVITFGRKGALAVLPDRAYQIPALPVEIVSTAGAGDGVLAGLAAAFERKEPIEEGLRLGFAAATAVCLTPATADCRKEDIEALLPRIQLIPFHQ